MSNCSWCGLSHKSGSSWCSQKCRNDERLARESRQEKSSAPPRTVQEVIHKADPRELDALRQSNDLQAEQNYIEGNKANCCMCGTMTHTPLEVIYKKGYFTNLVCTYKCEIELRDAWKKKKIIPQQYKGCLYALGNIFKAVLILAVLLGLLILFLVNN